MAAVTEPSATLGNTISPAAFHSASQTTLETSELQLKAFNAEKKQDEETRSSDEVVVPVNDNDAPNSTLPTANHQSAIPNGGAAAWLQVVGAFMVFFNSWGILNTFGAFQTYYESGQLFEESSSNIAWIGAIQAYSVLFAGLITGPIYDRGYLRSLLVVGGFGIVFGHMMLSLSHTFWQALLAQGFCIGLGAGIMFTPTLAVLPTYFNTRVGLAIGLAASGSSFGGIVYPVAFYNLIDTIGFPWAVRVLGFIAFATMLVPIFFMKQRVRPAHARALLDLSAFTDWPFVTFVLSTLVGYTGLYVILFYLSYFGQSSKITDASLSFYIVAILNATSMFGRTLPAALSDKTGSLNLIIPGAFFCALLNFVMLAVDSVAGIVVVALCFGFFSGVFVSLPPVLSVAFSQDKSKIGTRMGMGFAVLGFGVLIGGPGGGAILGSGGVGGEENWRGLWIFGGVTSMISVVVYITLRIWKVGFKINAKV
ncbi:putative MFS monocarboxylate transporter [Pseudomassariella vexata]|uniref:Putative MFS monocarboxylate transporter n=1 Tax=Pseudomassariella vexata TaxID=1141098 RepID=A0A1Y2DXM4_9PEZI|nr:putative MFS monocarboxylate transporter [Pseudomassariella vexata]ORY63876.1 putative MFS monocarboxylate transporter [Pseudomassariella vexata]